MYCLIQLYIPIAGYLVQHKPLLKLFAIKAVGGSVLSFLSDSDADMDVFREVFLTFWQATFLSLLSSFGVIKDVCLLSSLYSGFGEIR